LIGIFDMESTSYIEQHDNLGKLAAFSVAPNQKLAVSLSTEEFLTVWDMKTWTKQMTITSVVGYSLSFSPDSAHLAIATVSPARSGMLGHGANPSVQWTCTWYCWSEQARVPAEPAKAICV